MTERAQDQREDLLAAGGFRLTASRAAVVQDGYYWRPIDEKTPRGAKLQLINRQAGVAAYGVLVSLLVNTLTEPQGPFMGVGRAVPLFLIILYACVGTVASGETTEAGQAPQPGQLPNRAS